MKVHRLIKFIFLLVICMFSSFLASTVYGKDVNESNLRKTDFAFVINFTDGPESGKVYLLGKYASGIDVTLLHKNQDMKCSAQTTSNNIRMDSSGADLTEIKGMCVKPEIYKLAVITKRVENYKHIKPIKINNTKIIAAFDKQAKRSKALLQLRDKNQDGQIMDLQNLSGAVPRVLDFNIPSGKYYIISYKDNVFEVSGPRLAVFKDSIYPLNGWCSYGEYYVFLLNDEYFIQSGSMCCGCGVTTIELFKLNQTGVIKFLSDSSLSD